MNDLLLFNIALAADFLVYLNHQTSHKPRQLAQSAVHWFYFLPSIILFSGCNNRGGETAGCWGVMSLICSPPTSEFIKIHRLTSSAVAGQWPVVPSKSFLILTDHKKQPVCCPGCCHNPRTSKTYNHITSKEDLCDTVT